MERTRGLREREPRLVHLDSRRAGRRGRSPRVHHRDGAGAHGVGGEARAVGVYAGECEEHVPGTHATRVEHEPAYFRIERAARRGAREREEQVAQRHGRRSDAEAALTPPRFAPDSGTAHHSRHSPA